MSHGNADLVHWGLVGAALDNLLLAFEGPRWILGALGQSVVVDRVPILHPFLGVARHVHQAERTDSIGVGAHGG